VRTGKIPIGEPTPIPAPDHPWIEAISKEYFGRFHEAWPLLHAPSYTIGMEDSFLVAVSVAMISCWLKSPDEFGEVVMEMHETFMNVFSDWIVSLERRFLRTAILMNPSQILYLDMKSTRLGRQKHIKLLSSKSSLLFTTGFVQLSLRLYSTY
jgi:hypothetical protein